MKDSWSASGWVWTALAGPYLAAAGLLVLAGVPKLRDPMPLVRALRSAGWPSGRRLVRLVAGVEVVVGVAAVVRPSRPTALLLAISYAVFTAFVVVALRRGGVLASCGCFGRADTPPTIAHAASTAGAALVALAIAVRPPVTPSSTGPSLGAPWTAAPVGTVVAVLLLAGLVGFLAWQVMAVLPTVTPAAVRSTGRR